MSSLVGGHRWMTQMDPGGVRSPEERTTRNRVTSRVRDHRRQARPEPDLASSPTGEESDGGVSWWPMGALLFVVAGIIGFLIRWWQITGRAPSWWQDSSDYETSAGASLGSMELWAGARSPGVPLMLKIFGGKPGNAYIYLQIVLAAACWAWLAATVAVGLRGTGPRGTWRRWIVTAVIVAFPLARPIAMWDHSVLSESLTTSLFAGLVATAVWFVRKPSPLRVLAVVGAAAAWVATRDANVLAIAVVGVGIVAYKLGGAVRRLASHQPIGRSLLDLTAALAVGLLAVSGLSVLSSSIGDRDAVPLAHVFSVRILPYPDRLDWFADQGMPQADLLRSRAEDLDPARQPPLLGLSATDKLLEPWWDWLRSDGRPTFARWLLTHPTYLISEPLESPERTFNNAEGDLDFYRSAQVSEVPLVTDLLWLNIGTALLAGCAVVACYLWFGRRPRSDLLLIGTLCVVTAGPQAFVAWHSDGMETARHLYMPGVQLRVGVLLGAIALVVLLADRLSAPPGTRSDRARPETSHTPREVDAPAEVLTP